MSRADNFDFGFNKDPHEVEQQEPALDRISDMVRAKVREITQEVKNDMAGKRKQRQSQFLKPEHLNKNGKTKMNVLSVGYIGDSGYGLKINFEVEIGKKRFTFGMKPSNLSIKTLINNAIARKAVDVEVDDYNGNDYVKVVD